MRDRSHHSSSFYDYSNTQTTYVLAAFEAATSKDAVGPSLMLTRWVALDTGLSTLESDARSRKRDHTVHYGALEGSESEVKQPISGIVVGAGSNREVLCFER